MDNKFDIAILHDEKYKAKEKNLSIYIERYIKNKINTFIVENDLAYLSNLENLENELKKNDIDLVIIYIENNLCSSKFLRNIINLLQCEHNPIKAIIVRMEELSEDSKDALVDLGNQHMFEVPTGSLEDLNDKHFISNKMRQVLDQIEKGYAKIKDEIELFNSICNGVDEYKLDICKKYLRDERYTKYRIEVQTIYDQLIDKQYKTTNESRKQLKEKAYSIYESRKKNNIDDLIQKRTKILDCYYDRNIINVLSTEINDLIREKFISVDKNDCRQIENLLVYIRELEYHSDIKDNIIKLLLDRIDSIKYDDYITILQEAKCNNNHIRLEKYLKNNPDCTFSSKILSDIELIIHNQPITKKILYWLKKHYVKFGLITLLIVGFILFLSNSFRHGYNMGIAPQYYIDTDYECFDYYSTTYNKNIEGFKFAIKSRSMQHNDSGLTEILNQYEDNNIDGLMNAAHQIEQLASMENNDQAIYLAAYWNQINNNNAVANNLYQQSASLGNIESLSRMFEIERDNNHIEAVKYLVNFVDKNNDNSYFNNRYSELFSYIYTHDKEFCQVDSMTLITGETVNIRLYLEDNVSKYYDSVVKASDNGNLHYSYSSIFEICGMMYLNGVFFKQDYNKALKYFTRAKTQLAYYNAGCICLMHNTYDIVKSIENFTNAIKSSDKNASKAMYNLSYANIQLLEDEILETGELNNLVPILENAMKLGCKKSANMLGLIYSTDNEYFDVTKAIKCFEYAMSSEGDNEGLEVAKYNLGIKYFFGSISYTHPKFNIFPHDKAKGEELLKQCTGDYKHYAENAINSNLWWNKIDGLLW